MTILKRLLPVLAASAIVAAPTSAQDEAFDLSSQRSEEQTVLPVPGKKIEGRAIVINPTPHRLTIDPEGKRLDASTGFAVNDKQKAFISDIAFLKQNPKGVKLNIDFSNKEKYAKKLGLKSEPGAYVLTITPKGIDIFGYDQQGAFYGLQSLRQILSSPGVKDGIIPALSINDYPDLKYRGVVEGFYGEPWSHEVRLSLIDFYGRNKMNTYLYGPKDDPYHSSPYWRQPYPAEQERNIKELVDASKRARVDFVWAIHPGKDIRWNQQDYDSLVAKFNMMYDLGVRSFALFFDDIEGEGTNPVRQVELLNRLNKDFVEKKGDVSNLVVCPTDYSRLWIKTQPDGPLPTYGRSLDKNVEVMYTGDVVCSDLTKDTMDFFNNLVKRPGYYWWNYPVSDYCRNYILQGPSYGLDTTLTRDDVVALVSNPMEHGEASKLALYGVADYSWNIAGYNPIDSWERSLVEMMPANPQAYRTFAIHSADTENGYRRDESWETTIFPFNDYTQKEFNDLMTEFKAVEAAPADFEKACNNPLLLKELKPWLTEFKKLGQRGIRTLGLIDMYKTATPAEFWKAYIANIMTPQERADYQAHKSGTMKLQPFYDNNMTEMLVDFYTRMTGSVPSMHHGVGTYPSLYTSQYRLMLDGTLDTHFTSGQSQTDGDWIGLDLRDVRPLRNISIHQGRNDVNDSDYFDNVILEASADGKQWTALSEPMAKTYVIKWSATTPVDARFVRIRRLESDRKSWATVREFVVNPVTPDVLGFKVATPDSAEAMRAFDNDPTTSYTLSAPIEIDAPKNMASLTIFAGANPSYTVRFINAKGKEISSASPNEPFAKLDIAPETAKIIIEGNATFYEIFASFK
ncbi:MAG: beta-N-acetylglucosaminidase domain-containing protein [Muribaculaceae bacterium]|nr:beta-N-acetylglucosaminidase domain-containing protein [Muribaculaceae bacterium]